MEEIVAEVLRTLGTGGLPLAVYWYATRDRLADKTEEISWLRAQLIDLGGKLDEEQKFRRGVIERAIQRKNGANGRTDS